MILHKMQRAVLQQWPVTVRPRCKLLVQMLIC